MDDTFVLWPYEEDELETFHRLLNSQHPSIQFMIEESEGKISFLDVQIARKERSPQEYTERTLSNCLHNTGHKTSDVKFPTSHTVNHRLSLLCFSGMQWLQSLFWDGGGMNYLCTYLCDRREFLET